MPERVIRWLHLSDFHCGDADYLQKETLDDLLKHIDEKWRSTGPPDLVFITGDVAHSGKKAQYDFFRQSFLAKLSDKYGEEYLSKIFVVPGNHDVDIDAPVIGFGPGRDVLKENPKSMIPDPHGQRLREHILPRFLAFQEAKLSPTMEGWLSSEEGCWSNIVSVNGYEVGILASNTAWFAKDKEDRGKLSPGNKIIKAGLNKIDNASIKIVLGHHPIDWFEEDSKRVIEKLLSEARYGAIYLHGHLHRGFARNIDGGRKYFRVFSGGAVFESEKADALEGYPLEARLNWVEILPDHGVILIEPYKFSDEEWKIDFDVCNMINVVPGQYRWWFPLPGQDDKAKAYVDKLPGVALSSPPSSAPPESTSTPTPHVPSVIHKAAGDTPRNPEGWWDIDRRFLADQKTKSIVPSDALAFFDGWEPDWAIALSPAAPQRNIVVTLRDQISEAVTAPQRSVTLLCAPSGEGKSTLLMHTVDALLKTDLPLNVIWQSRSGLALPLDFVENLPKTGDAWLIVADEADLILDDLLEAVKLLKATTRSDVHFLLAARDTAWLAVEAHRKPWAAICRYRQPKLGGLTDDDAELLVGAWSEYRTEGLKSLAGYAPDEAARALVNAAKEGAKLPEGSLFAALLNVRYTPEALKERLLTLLDNFKGKQALPEVSLLQAYAYVAAPHAVGINVLTKDVLARAFRCKPGDVWGVIQRFGKEAFLPAYSRFITTRDKKIAKVACDLLGEQFGVDMDEVYVDLVRAATQEVMRDGDVIMTPWNGLRDHFAKNGQLDLAVRIARAQYETAPTSRNLVKLSQLLRESKNAAEAARLFRASSLRPRDDRGFYFEWASAEGEAGHYAIAAWLAAYSLADTGGRDALGREQAKKSLAGLGMAFLKLHEATQDHDYALALGAVGQLGRRVTDDPTALGYFQRYSREATKAGVGKQPAAQAWQAIELAIKKARETCKDDLPGIPSADKFTYQQLLNLLDLPQDAPT